MSQPRSDPRAEYETRLSARRADAARYATFDARVSYARAAVVAAAALLAWFVWHGNSLSAGWLAIPAVVFVGLVILHDRVIRARRRYGRAVAFYESALARLANQWAGQGESGDRFLEAGHPYAADLNLFGQGSLFELLCTARTDAGQRTLASWLKGPGTPAEIRARQAAVRELQPALDLREDLALLGADLRNEVHPVALESWGIAPAVLNSQASRIAAFGLAAAIVCVLAAWIAGLTGPVPVLIAGLLVLSFGWRQRAGVRQVIGHVDTASDELGRLSKVLERLERESFSSPRLVALRNALDTVGQPPSRRIAVLRRLVSLLDARRNQLFLPISYVLLWATQLAYALEAWRTASGSAVPRWLASVGEIEALCALAGYAFEHPDDPFPEIVEVDRGPIFDGEGLGHPLLPAATNVRNGVRLAGAGLGDEGPHALVVSGSNMSGKSTLLRTVGANTVLALAGAPVRASRLVLTPLSIGATLRIQDSLQAGTSRFYAEITRLRTIVDLASSTPPLLFLLDEMLNGTNSHDRRIGAEALLRGLVRRNAVGLVTTHDLALSHIADVLAPGVVNVHFEDHLENGRMTFDYVCRPGVVTKSNALALMAAVGLEV